MDTSSNQSGWLREALAIAVMSMAVIAVYWSPKPAGYSQLASDFNLLHTRRMEFARQELFEAHRLPAWYPRELLGTPFWSNVQNFPFIPTRLLLLLLLDPNGTYTYTLAINLAAVLAAVFTYLYLRKISMGMTASASAGWTFACCGFFASRMAAGHLPLLEVYFALPLLLWLTESLIQAIENHRPAARWFVGLSAGSTCVLLGGHPQLPVYALATTVVYALCRGGWRKAGRAFAAMALGAGCAAFQLVPMMLLVRRSTRILPLAPADNDLAMPYRRLAGFFFPWLDGAGSGLARAATEPFHGYFGLAFFWDTFVYAGWLPWIALLLLLHLFFFQSRRPRWFKPASFVAVLGGAAIILSLPLAQQAMSFIPGTFLRSPARLLYVTEFFLALALGGMIELLSLGLIARWTRWLVPVLLLLHALDVGSTDREFLVVRPFNSNPKVIADVDGLVGLVGDERMAIDYSLIQRSNRRADDVGFFDSIMLARPYRWLMDLGREDPTMNLQVLSGSQLPVRPLEAAGVKFMITTVVRPDLDFLGTSGPLYFYRIVHPARRAGLFTADQIQCLDPMQIHERLRDPQFDPHATLLLPHGYELSATPAAGPAPSDVEYRRPNSDRIECVVKTAQPGYLRIIESWDPGWSATLDGSPAEVIPAEDALLAVSVPAGNHEVRLEYHTPGAYAGIGASLISLTLLVFLGLSLRHRKPAVGEAGPGGA